jgi:DNA repair protein RadA/Sms
MGRMRLSHRCSSCGSTFPRWSGRCPQCGEWNTLAEEPSSSTPSSARSTTGAPAGALPVPLAAVSLDAGTPWPTGFAEVDRVLTGGLVPGSVTLIGGEPGIGKSTLVFQLAAGLAAEGRRVLLVSGEETASQVRRRAERLGGPLPALDLLATSSLPDVLSACAQAPPELLVVDSIQTVSDPETNGGAGSVGQVACCAQRLVEQAKSIGVATVLVGHVTKDGSLAGPRQLEHLVDTVLSFDGDRHHELRLLSVLKHRFGPTGELGVLSMSARGLAAVGDPSQLLLADRRPGVAGSVVVPLIEGRRPLLAELQTLVAPSSLGTPRRAAQGVPASRLAILVAVLEQRVGCVLSSMDVFSSVVGGLRVAEPAADLALALALVSARYGVPLGEQVVACGEVGLGGEVRQVSHLERRLAEARRLGFSQAIVPCSAPRAPSGMTLLRVGTLSEAVQLLAAA